LLGDGADHDAAITVADKYNPVQVSETNRLNDIRDVRFQVDFPIQ
jgi:hypothetical protein